MIPMTEAQKSAYMSDSAHKQIRLIFPQYKGGLTITNENIDAESLDINRSIMDGDELEVVGCISTAFSITIHDVERSDDLVGQLLFCDINANNTGWVRFFNGNVSSVEKGANRTIHTIKAYDALHDAMNVDMTEFYNNHLACTLDELIKEVLPPWDYADFNLPNGNTVVPMGTVHKVESISKTDLLKSICQIAGCFGYITGDNKFNIYVMSQNDDHNTARVPAYKALDYETYETVSITDVVIKESESDEGMSLNQKAIVEMLWNNAPQAQTFSTLDEYKAYYASNLTPYSALISDSDKYSSLATKDRYVFDVSFSQATMKELEKGDVSQTWTYDEIMQAVADGHSYFKATFSTGSGSGKKNYDATFMIYQMDATVEDQPRIWAAVIEGYVYVISDRLTSILSCAEVAYIRSGTKGVDQWTNPIGGSGSSGGQFVGMDGHTYYYMKYTPNEFVLKEHNLPVFEWDYEFTPVISESYTITPVGVTWDWTIEKAIRQVIKATGMSIDYETPEVRKLISDTKNALISKGWGSRIGGIVVMPSEDWITNRQFADDCMQIMFDLGLYPYFDVKKTQTYNEYVFDSVDNLFHTIDEFAEMIDSIGGNGTNGGGNFGFGLAQLKSRWESAMPDFPIDGKYMFFTGSDWNESSWYSGSGFVGICIIKMPNIDASYVSFNLPAISNHNEYIDQGRYVGYGISSVKFYDANKKEISYGEGKMYDVTKDNVMAYTYSAGWAYGKGSSRNYRNYISWFGIHYGIRGTVRQEGCKIPQKASDTTSSLYGNDWNSYLYHAEGNGSVITKDVPLDTWIPAGSQNILTPSEVVASAMSLLPDVNSKAFLQNAVDTIKKEHGIDFDSHNYYCVIWGYLSTHFNQYFPRICIMEYNSGSSISFTVRRQNIYSGQGKTVSFKSSQDVNVIYPYEDFEVIMDVTYYNESYSANEICRVGNDRPYEEFMVDSFDEFVNSSGAISLLKLGKGESQAEVWNGSIEDVQHNVYTVLGNIFWYDQPDRMTMLYNLYNEIAYLADFSYRPFEASFPAMPWLECGDQIILTDKIDGEMLFRAFTMHIHGIGSIFCDASAEGNQYQNTFTTSLGISLLDDTRAIAEEALEKATAASEQVVIIERDYATRAWTAEELAKAIEAINQFNIKILDSLPTTGESGTLYFIKKTDPEQGDIYEEYMWINNAWEKVGSTKIDLSDYVKKSDLFMSLVNGIPSITFEEV